MKKLTVYLADLFYGQRAKFHGVPLNVGYIGNALKTTYSDAVEVELFKYPEDLISALKRKKPDILGLSNYVWNQLLSLKLARLAKEISKDIFTVMGGPHIRADAAGMQAFLEENKEIDCYIPFVGEFPLIELVGGILKTGCSTKIDRIYQAIGPVTGAFLNTPGYEYRQIAPSVWKDIFKFGSPYLNGLMDKFIADVTLMPLFESNRGCPYSCTYCAFGVGNYRKIYINDMATVLKEFRYVVERGAKQKQWYIADANFGIFPRDIEIAKALRNINKKHGYPITVNGTTGKGPSFKNVIEITRILGNIFEPNVAVQSFDPEVLSKINRRNLADTTIKKLIKIYAQNGAETSTDIIVGLSGESFQSHISTLKKAMELDLSFQVATLALLPGTIMDSPEQRNKYGFDTRFRLRADTYGMYDGDFIFDIEEVVCATNTLSFEEFLDLRCIHLLIYMLWTSGIARRLLKFAEKSGEIAPLDIIYRIQQEPTGKALKELLANLRRELKAQFFKTKKELMKYYKDQGRIDAILRDGNMETKLFWKYFAYQLIKKDNVVALIDEVVMRLSSCKNIDQESLNVLRNMAADQLMVDFGCSSVLSKKQVYKINHENYLLLVKNEIIPKTAKYRNGEMTIKYSYDKKRYNHYHEIMERFKYKENLHGAINAALNLNLGANLQYDIVGP